MNKYAKRLRDVYGVAYSTALQLIRTHGLDGAIEQIEETKRKQETRAQKDNPA
jgi:hypothetical protein